MIMRWVKKHPRLKKLGFKTVELLMTGIVFAVVASLLTQYISEQNTQRSLVEKRLTSISSIYIGCSKEWVDEQFGAPQFIGEIEGYTMCAYLSDFYLLQFAFNESFATEGYMVTSLENEENIQIEIKGVPVVLASTTLGEFSFYDFPGAPSSAYGFVTQGLGRALYAERYYFGNGGNYYEYYIASFDYGVFEGTLQDFIFSNQYIGIDEKIIIDDEVDSSIRTCSNMLNDRKNNCPNTYGVVRALNYTTVEKLFFDYGWFNSLQLRDRDKSFY